MRPAFEGTRVNSTCRIGKFFLTAAFLIAVGALKSSGQTASLVPVNEIRIIELQGSVNVFFAGATNWVRAQSGQILHQQDRVQTSDHSRLGLLWSDKSVVSFATATEFEILAPDLPRSQPGLHIMRGVLSFFHRDQPGRIRISTRAAVAGVEGTEFVLAVDDAETTTLSVIDGKVKFGNEQGALTLVNGEQADAHPGEIPARSGGFIANNLLQWCFYYPAVMDPDELPLTTDEQTELAASLTSYRAGNLPTALENFPTNVPATDGAKVYHAALLLSVGEVKNAETMLSSIAAESGRAAQLVTALRQLIAAVKRQAPVTTSKPALASEFLAASYYEQSCAIRESSLKEALRLARAATKISPKFSFAWERTAELEFSFGRAKAAADALEKSLELAPRNAQALALKGFILAAQNKPHEARDWFDRAISADSALGNAWLGRGLVRLRLGEKSGGREDLLVAAALEPQRAELRSYLGKAYASSGDYAHAEKELALAKKLDPNDPTAWLYSALLNQQGNQINAAIRDLEKSQALNDNRSVYRSQLLLDEDRAVRSANLARIYRDAGMFDVSLREASRAVSSDYANYSAHLFLANSYEQLRDPNWSNLRYEAPATSEFWIANLLAPTGAGWLSSTISEQPSARLFDQNRVGILSDTTYLSRGAWTEKASQFYTSGNFSYALGASYVYDPGQRLNNDNENREWDVNLKGQLTSQDSVFFTYQQATIENGDLNEHFSQSSAFPDIRFRETHDPNLFAGYHHEWSPGSHTLFFATRESGYNHAMTGNAGHWFASTTANVFQEFNLLVDTEQLAISPRENSVELQQIVEQPGHATIVGGRYSWGDVRFQNMETYGHSAIVNIFPDPRLILSQDISTDFHHLTLYGYHDWQVMESLKVSGGVSYDWLHEPSVVDSSPFSNLKDTKVLLSPKAGLIWTPRQDTVVRAAYTRSLSGFINDSSLRLEPTEVAGFNQAYRSIIPTTVIGDNSGSQLDAYNLSLEQKFDTGTYLALSGEILHSKGDKAEGGFVYLNDEVINGLNDNPIYPVGLRKSLEYHERSLVVTADQLLGNQWTAGTRYRVSQAGLHLSYVDVNPAKLMIADPSFRPRQSFDSLLQTMNLHANWNHASGLFSTLEANWYHQNNSGYSPAEPGDDFWQLNAYAGCRFWHRRAEVTVGLLNITDQNYRLEPLNFYNEMARSRTLLARFLVSF